MLEFPSCARRQQAPSNQTPNHPTTQHIPIFAGKQLLMLFAMLFCNFYAKSKAKGSDAATVCKTMKLTAYYGKERGMRSWKRRRWGSLWLYSWELRGCDYFKSSSESFTKWHGKCCQRYENRHH